jgi:two-component system, LytTR family, sensor kinase
MSETMSMPSAAVLPPRSGRRWIQVSELNWPAIFVLYNVLALISTGTMYTLLLAQRSPRPFLLPFIWEFTGYEIAFAFSPVIVMAFSLLPIRRHNWYWSVPAHLLISIGIGVMETLLMGFTRQEIYGWLELGKYDYGLMEYRFLMEYHKQFVAYWTIYVALRVWVHYQQSRERERQAAELELKTSELERELTQAQLQALRSQLNPHFLFNTLNMVSSVMYEDVDRADHMIAALSRMLRMTLEENVAARVSLRRELEFVQCAVELIEARFQDRVAIDIQCPADAMDLLVPNMVLYTFIENAIKHHEAERDRVIRIQAHVERNAATLDIHVLDNGPGIANLERAMRQGTGLRNTRQRLLALYGDRQRFEIQNRREGGLHVHVAIPVAAAPVLQGV